MIEALNSRFRHIVAFLMAAVFIAALLRHTVHVYGGIPPEQIRAGALMVMPLVLLLLIVVDRKHPE